MDTLRSYIEPNIDGARIDEIPFKKVPREIIREFENIRRRFVLPDDLNKVPPIGTIYKITNQDSTYTYYTLIYKTLYPNEKLHEETIHLIEFNNKGKRIGHGTITLQKPEEFYDEKDETSLKDKPYFDMNKTEEWAKRKGYGKRRILTGNALAQSFWGLPLHSSTNILDESITRFWEQFVNIGVAERYEENGKIRFKFKS